MLETNDLAALRSMVGMTPYEQFKTQHMQAKGHTSGVGIAGLVLGTVGTAVAVGSWIFSPLYGNAKASQAKEAAQSAKEITMAYISGIDKRLDNIGGLLEAEVTRRIQGDQTITQTITDTVSGSQQGTLTANQMADLNAIQSVQNNLFNQAVMGNLREAPQRVTLWRDAQACPCPGSCGCNG